MKNVTSKNTQDSQRPSDVKNLGRTGRESNRKTGSEKGASKQASISDKDGRGESKQGRESNFLDALTCQQFQYYRPARREFMDCDLETVYKYYFSVISDVFSIKVKHFVDKANLKKKVGYLMLENMTLLEIVNFISKYQDEIQP